jgi:threonine dehydrogenase-like Zn-dependent dehydrogenase
VIHVARPYAVAARRALAKAMGADAVLDPNATNVIAEIRKDTGNRGVDVAIDCAAKDGTMNQCLYVTRNAGRIVYTGIPSERTVELEFHEIRRKELTLYNVRRSNHETDLAIKLLLAHPSLFAPVLTHQRSLSQIGAAFDMMEHYGDGAAKVTISPSQA